MKTKRYRPYVRRANGREKAETMRIAFRLAFYQSLGKPFYVMVQHGFPNLAIDAGPSKREVKQSPVLVRFGRKTFRRWSKDVQLRACGAA